MNAWRLEQRYFVIRESEKRRNSLKFCRFNLSEKEWLKSAVQKHYKLNNNNVGFSYMWKNTNAGQISKMCLSVVLFYTG